MGFSQGAILAYLVGIKYHYLFRGLISLSGPGLLSPLNNPFVGPSNQVLLTDEFIQSAKELSVLIAHGKDDQAADIELGIKSRNILLKHGYDVTFIDFEGGHSLPPKEILAQIVNWIRIR
jgi:predicted esterase